MKTKSREEAACNHIQTAFLLLVLSVQMSFQKEHLGLQMSFICVSVKLLTRSTMTFFSLNWREMDLIGGVLDGQEIGWTVTSSGQWLRL